jgi:hypothetical protein
VRDNDGVRLSLEVRWVFGGGLPSTMVEWLGPFPSAAEEREDRYLIDPHIPTVSLKIRGVTCLDLKISRGSPGELQLAHGGRGRLEFWEKLSFPLGAIALPSIAGSRWVSVEKLRRRRSFTSSAGGSVERSLSDVESPGCSVELTEVHVGGGLAWTLAFEALGPPTELPASLRVTAANLLREPPPGNVKLDLPVSISYIRWLRSPKIGRQASGWLPRR